ncbi:hypothetical protein D9615_008537 [Tricholomella constricta]|uniref:Uncharacterized protein n=1 Tax=Tricholomella constricta TaxID=117010 RepID=A0A8H5H3K9_9AGAR|nr:hypothetical protein D9615_008537 [Tricholomella constricta]
MSTETRPPPKIVSMIATPTLLIKKDGTRHLTWTCEDFISPEPVHVGDMMIILAREEGWEREIRKIRVVVERVLQSGNLAWVHLHVTDNMQESSSIHVPSQFVRLEYAGFIQHLYGPRTLKRPAPAEPQTHSSGNNSVPEEREKRVPDKEDGERANDNSHIDSNKRPPEGSPAKSAEDRPRPLQKPRRLTNLDSQFPDSHTDMPSQEDDPFGTIDRETELMDAAMADFPPLPPPGVSNQALARQSLSGPRHGASPSPSQGSPSPAMNHRGDAQKRQNHTQDAPQQTPKERADALHFFKDAGCPWELTDAGNGSAGNQNGLTCTATPNGGFPEIHLRAAPSFNVTTALLLRWQNKTGPKVWARMYDGKFDPRPLDDVLLICDLIKKTVDAEDVIVAPPTRLNQTAGRIQHPFHFLITDISQSAADTLIERQTISTAEATIFIVPYEPITPSFIMSLCDLTYPLTPKSHEDAASFVRQTLHRHSAIAKFIHDHLEGPPDARVVAQAYASIYVKGILVHRLAGPEGPRMKSKPQIVWNVYFGVTLKLALANFYTLISMIRDLSFSTGDYGEGRPLKGDATFQCAGCKSTDHPRAMCPFMDLPGWLGPKRQEVSDQPYLGSATRGSSSSRHPGGAGRGRGRARGRGRGRGGRGRGHEGNYDHN